MVRYYDGERSAVGSVDMARPLREFHLTEDLNTQWANQERFTVPLATYFARTVGMTTEESGTVPLLVAERDTLAPQPNCELEKVGQLLFDKYEKLVDTDPDLATMFLLQAAKFKPELAQKHWGGDALKTLKDVLGADDAQEQVSTAARGRLWPRCAALLTPMALCRATSARSAGATLSPRTEPSTSRCSHSQTPRRARCSAGCLTTFC